MTAENPLLEIIRAHKAERPKGIYSVCSSNPFVIEACLEQEQGTDEIVLIESTSNQVNQFGGYTGMNPAQFSEYVHHFAGKTGFPGERILLGGDHLGPNVWRDEPAKQAMEKSCELVSDCVKAGYSKIHLDASMKCGDDDPDRPLDIGVSARRAAAMCRAAEDAVGLGTGVDWKPCYIIGTEVPVPGGTLSGEEELNITNPEDARETIELTRQAFRELGLEEAWKRVIGVVVQPGVEFGDSTLLTYNREDTCQLSRFIEEYDGLVYEAHSTDYQTPESLRQMVEDHFAILKVGPALTFSLREGLFALEFIERDWLDGREGMVLSNLQGELEKAMLDNPEHWIEYFQGDEDYLRFARKYSYSDRIRYYWSNREVQESMQRLFTNLSGYPAPGNLLSQYMPYQYRKVMQGELTNRPADLIRDQIRRQIGDYIYACRGQ